MQRSIKLILNLILLLAPFPILAEVGNDCGRLLAETNTSLSVVTSEFKAATDQLPGHCRVHGFIHPAVNFELKLPLDWNGKFFMVGNGGYLGEFFDQSYGLARGYATATTDTGHQGPDPRFAHNNRAAEIDFAFRAIHVTVVAAKHLIEAFYDKAPQYSYYRGCSTGGRQGLMEAQRFPDDFDGWSIGAPIYDYTYKQTYNAAWAAKALFDNNKTGYVSKRKLKALGQAVYKKCDAIDGLEDGLIDDPRKCDFDPQRDLQQCPAGKDGIDCFSKQQLDAIAKIYDGPGADIYPGAVKGGEWLPGGPKNAMTGGWDVYFTGMEPAKDDSGKPKGIERNAYGGSGFIPVQFRNGNSFFKYLAFEKDQPDFNFLTDLDFNNVPDVSFMAGLMNATNPDLSRIHKGGKKIILWHGWADVGLNPNRTIQYYDAVNAKLGKNAVKDFMRLYLVPGMYHCSGGPGPDIFDDLTALEEWVEKGTKPGKIIAYKTKGQNDFYPNRAPTNLSKSQITRSRPLCSYPKVARYQGKGSIDEAKNFTCTD